MKISHLHLSRSFETRRTSGDTFGGITLAFIAQKAALPTGQDAVIIHGAIAVCREDEAFVRATGINISSERLISYVESGYTPTVHTFTMFAGIASDANAEEFPAHSVPVFEKEGQTFILNAAWNTTEYLIQVARGMIGAVHPELSL